MLTLCPVTDSTPLKATGMQPYPWTEVADCAGNMTMLPGNEQLLLQFGAPFTSGQILTLHFEYPLSEGLSGFYRSEYQGGSTPSSTAGFAYLSNG